ncbi:MAG: hypothetical protein WCQ16_10720 [Verrucomicrobiae bacterium]
MAISLSPQGVLHFDAENPMLALLRCPLSGQSLRPATPEELKRFLPDCDAALMREDGRMFYPVRNGIPLLVASAVVDAKESLPDQKP